MAEFKLKMQEAKERDIQGEIIAYLRRDSRVAWVERFNTGAHVVIDSHTKRRRFIRYGFKGLSDLLGQLSDGRLFAVECKSRTGKPTVEQQVFLEKVRGARGVAILARSVSDVKQGLEEAQQGGVKW